MYLLFSEVILIKNKAKRKVDDLVVYIEDNVRLIPGAYPDVPTSSMQRYGTIYLDASERWCVVPDEWREQDAYRAKMWID